MNIVWPCLPSLSLLAVLTLLSTTGPASPAAHGTTEPLDWAARFASAINVDPVDQAKAQEKVVRDYLALGATEEATRCAGMILGWRSGTAWADIAVALANRGKTNEAAGAIHKAEAAQRAFRLDWQGARIGAHLARAYAALGDLDRTRNLAATLPSEEATKARVAAATGLVGPGKFDEAMELLKSNEGTQVFDQNFQLLDGYIEISRHPALARDAAKRKQALDGAARVLETMPLLRRAEVGPIIARGYHGAGETAAARKLLDTIEKEITVTPMEPVYQAPALAQIALVWREIGDGERSRKLLGQARALATTGDPMDQPAACAAVAAAFVEAGDAASAWQLYDKGLEIAAGFVNARPRALALVEICRSIGREKLELSETTHERLTMLFNGLKDPW